MIIYIRHGDDEERHPVYRNDHDLTEEGREDARRLGKKLIRKYGKPHTIYCSPYLRTRATATAMTETLEGKGKGKIKYEVGLSRYTGRKGKSEPVLHRDTEACDPPLDEDHEQCRNRIRKHIRSLERKGHLSSRRVIWCITHALVLKHVGNYFRVRTPKHIPFLHWFRVRETGSDGSR